MELLQSEKQYRRFAPETLLMGEHGDDWQPAHDLMDQFNAIVGSDSFLRGLPPLEARAYRQVHAGKLSHSVLATLDQWGLSKVPNDIEDGEPWRLVEAKTADLYLGLLATALAETANTRVRAQLLAGTSADEVEVVVTGTDRHRHETLVWRTESLLPQRDGFVEARWLGLLPTPGPEVPLEEIIEFKHKHHDQLLRLRAVTDKLGEDLANHDRPERIAVAWKERMQVELSTIARLMAESRWQVAWGSLKAMLNLKQLGGLGAAEAFTHLPIELASGGLAVSGAIEIGTQWMEQGRRKRQVLDGSPFSYLFCARKDGLFD
jgi:hypothetical protein